MIKFRGLRKDGNGQIIGTVIQPYTGECYMLDSASHIDIDDIDLGGAFVEVYPSTLQVMTTDGWADIADVEVVRKNVNVGNHALRFAEWLQENRWFSFYQGKWNYSFEHGSSISEESYNKNYRKTTEELYAKFCKEQGEQLVAEPTTPNKHG